MGRAVKYWESEPSPGRVVVMVQLESSCPLPCFPLQQEEPPTLILSASSYLIPHPSLSLSLSLSLSEEAVPARGSVAGAQRHAAGS